MCGISGLLGFEDPALIAQMVAIQAHRGPDQDGALRLCREPPLDFGHNRLSILDLSERGRQPMFDPTGRLCIVYNGEVYNWLDLRDELAALGHVFRSACDTEVILAGYAEWGLAVLPKLRGMFAIALYDAQRKQLVLARDPFGVKPLYYWSQGPKLAFASEAKALLLIPEVRAGVRLDPEVLTTTTALWWSHWPQTAFGSIRRLEVGTQLVVDLQSGAEERSAFYTLPIAAKPWKESEAVEALRRALDDSVRREMIADVKVGAFLSGGLDSSLITALMAQNTKEPIDTFTITFSEADQKIEANPRDEVYATKLARDRGWRMHKRVITEADTRELLPKLIWHMDEPIGDPVAVSTYLMAKEAKDCGVTVLLSGQGADELFGGYRRHFAALLTSAYKRRVPALARRTLEGLLNRLPVTFAGRGLLGVRRAKRLLLDKPEAFFDIYYALLAFHDPKRLPDLFAPALRGFVTDRMVREVFESFSGSVETRMCATDTRLFLPGLNLNYCDKATMAASIECRVPFVDAPLAALAFSLPDELRIRGFEQKYLLKKAAEPYLPKSLIYRAKMPFSSPLRAWIKTGLGGMIDDYLSPERLRRQGLYAPETVARLLREDRAGQADHAHVLFGITAIQIWLDTFQMA